MSLKQQSLPVVVVLLLSLTTIAMACCGHCQMRPHSNESAASLSQKDSIAVQNFSESNSDLLNKIRDNSALIKEEYSKEKPDLDKIGTLKKKGVDYHTELEKREGKKDLHKHHNCWCPMHQ